jgi:hypothetical protein
VRTEVLPDGHEWLRLADPRWTDPLDPRFAQHTGGRWNPPDSFPTLYLNEDIVTARLNLRLFIEGWPYEPEDLRNDTGPVLVGATLPRRQGVLDAHTPEGLRAAGLPATYPTLRGALVDHRTCQQVGARAKAEGLRGVRSRSARAPDGAGRELAWFPAGSRSRATMTVTRRFREWYWA